MHDYSYLVNQCQCAAERQRKYEICRSFGLPHSEARRLRDWNWSKLRGQLGRLRPEYVAAIDDLIEDHYRQFGDHRKAVERQIRREARQQQAEYEERYPELAEAYI